jgi:hypothetical protein
MSNFKQWSPTQLAFLMVAGLGSLAMVLPMAAQSGTPAAKPAATAYAAQPSYLPRQARMQYEMVWGVDSLSVKTVESGEIVRFAWRVIDANKAKPLNDKKVDPILIDQQAGVKLVVPSLEKVGQLRQSSTPETGKSYWMAFSNSGRRVKRGDRVDVVIGNFRAQGLIVQ